jgi:DNA-binding transcriptional MocR family regulator
MDREWNDDQPIYRQVRDRVVAMILDGVLKEGDPLPSVRNVAAEYRVNPLTVLKGYQQLVDEGLVGPGEAKTPARAEARGERANCSDELCVVFIHCNGVLDTPEIAKRVLPNVDQRPSPRNHQ